jgi:hypothetical protein
MRGPDPNLLLGSLLGGEGQDAQQQHEQQAGILSSFFQHMSAAGINIAAGAADRDPAQQDGSPEAAAAAAAAGGGGGNPAAVSALLLLVGEDVERMAQQWRAAEVPKLQACAADIWRRCVDTVVASRGCTGDTGLLKAGDSADDTQPSAAWQMYSCMVANARVCVSKAWAHRSNGRLAYLACLGSSSGHIIHTVLRCPGCYRGRH